MNGLLTHIKALLPPPARAIFDALAFANLCFKGGSPSNTALEPVSASAGDRFQTRSGSGLEKSGKGGTLARLRVQESWAISWGMPTASMSRAPRAQPRPSSR